MISKFPKFTKIDIVHKEEIQYITSQFEPYSDFNFTSLFSWSTNDSTSISRLYDNLVITLPDYITGEKIYSILGNNKIDDSIDRLLDVTARISLVPEVTIKNIKKKNNYVLKSSRKHYDYIYKLDKQSELYGGVYRSKRKRVNKFIKLNFDKLGMSKINLNSKVDFNTVMQIFDDWAKDRMKENEEIEHEKQAVYRLLANARFLNVFGIFITLDSRYVGFSINEVLPNGFSICHFQKTITSIDYLDVFLTNLVAKELKHFECIYVNWEQDLGIPGLRELKNSYLPEKFLKKYTLTRV